MFDVHAHLTAPELLPHLESLLAEAHSAGVHDILVVSENLQDAALVLALPTTQGGVRLHKALGLHPEYACLEALSAMLTLIRTHHSELTCIGEIGLDYSPHVLGEKHPEATKIIQQECMRQQVVLALELDMAVNVHSRSAGHHALALLRETAATAIAAAAEEGPEGHERRKRGARAVFHAWDGKAHYAEAAASDTEHDIYFSVPPCAQRCPLMSKWIARLPLERLLLETDCPALAPFKGDVNLPKNLGVSVEVVGIAKGMGMEEIVQATRRNAERLFGLGFATGMDRGYKKYETTG
ncbi:deoxyribonuclease tatdn3 isoform x1 [Nannochloropsis oceanica]